MNVTRDRKLLLTVYFSFYYSVFFFFWLDHRLLFQYQPVLFNYNRDLTELALIATGLPGYMIAHPWTFGLADSLALLLPLLAILRRQTLSIWLGFALYLALYLLLANIFWQVHHEPFILYVLLAMAMATRRPERFYAMLRWGRYYFLYIFVSAALWKIARGAVFNGSEMSRILLLHHSDVLSGDCAGIQCQAISYLIDHPALAQCFYLGGVLLELVFAIGFFTRRYDRWLIGAALTFVVADLLLMRIPYWTILMGTVTLWIGSGRFSPTCPKLRAILIYETTHHENLPALLDLSEAHFEKVTLFLKQLSYKNLSGSGSPRTRWPRTQFVVQPPSVSNRVFLMRLFHFLRKHSYSHLHLSTVDNNWLLVALQVALAGNVRISMTVHMVNEYFTSAAGSVKSLTESAAKWLMRRTIHRYTFFLPAMAENFRQRLPQATTVVIPSRFYAPPSPIGPSLPFRIVIPGSIDPHRRDYKVVADFFQTYLPAPCPIELVLLGNSNTPFGADVKGWFQQSDNFRLITYEEYIPAEVYESQIAGASLLWSPLQSQKESEVYGTTVASGLTADLQLGNAPVLTPDWLQLPEPFRTAQLPYSGPAEIKAILDQILRDREYRRTVIDIAFAKTLHRKNFDEAFLTLMDLPASHQPTEKG